MFNKAIHFLKYNNATILILAVILIAGTGVFASEPGREAIGKKTTSVQGTDNTLLISADLDNLNMDFKIEKIEEDNKYYYVTYSFIDFVVKESAWQYQLTGKVKKVSKKLKEDLGVYLAKKFKDEIEARIRELKEEKDKAISQGEAKRYEVIEYSGLIGKTLDLAGQVFPNYEPVKKTELPAPVVEPSLEPKIESQPADDLTQVYLNYVAEHGLEQTVTEPTTSDNTADEPSEEAVQTPEIATEGESIPPVESFSEPDSVEIISLPQEEVSPAPEMTGETPQAQETPALSETN